MRSRIKEASISLSVEGRNGYCCGYPEYSTWKTSSFIHDCEGKKNESLEAEVFVSLCFDFVTPHQLLKKPVHTRFRLYETSRCIIESFLDSRKYEH